VGGERREGRGTERRGQERRVGGREGKGGELRREESGRRGKGRGKREGDAPLTQIPGSAPARDLIAIAKFLV